MKRKVSVFEWEYNAGKRKTDKLFVGTGTFHEFGCDYEEFENGAGNYSTAIVEMSDGSIKNVPVEMVTFICG